MCQRLFHDFQKCTMVFASQLKMAIEDYFRQVLNEYPGKAITPDQSDI